MVVIVEPIGLSNEKKVTVFKKGRFSRALHELILATPAKEMHVEDRWLVAALSVHHLGLVVDAATALHPAAPREDITALRRALAWHQMCEDHDTSYVARW